MLHQGSQFYWLFELTKRNFIIWDQSMSHYFERSMFFFQEN